MLVWKEQEQLRQFENGLRVFAQHSIGYSKRTKQEIRKRDKIPKIMLSVGA